MKLSRLIDSVYQKIVKVFILNKNKNLNTGLQENFIKKKFSLILCKRNLFIFK